MCVCQSTCLCDFSKIIMQWNWLLSFCCTVTLILIHGDIHGATSEVKIQKCSITQNKLPPAILLCSHPPPVSTPGTAHLFSLAIILYFLEWNHKVHKLLRLAFITLEKDLEIHLNCHVSINSLFLFTVWMYHSLPIHLLKVK